MSVISPLTICFKKKKISIKKCDNLFINILRDKPPIKASEPLNNSKIYQLKLTQNSAAANPKKIHNLYVIQDDKSRMKNYNRAVSPNIRKPKKFVFKKKLRSMINIFEDSSKTIKNFTQVDLSQSKNIITRDNSNFFSKYPNHSFNKVNSDKISVKSPELNTKSIFKKYKFIPKKRNKSIATDSESNNKENNDNNIIMINSNVNDKIMQSAKSSLHKYNNSLNCGCTKLNLVLSHFKEKENSAKCYYKWYGVPIVCASLEDNKINLSNASSCRKSYRTIRQKILKEKESLSKSGCLEDKALKTLTYNYSANNYDLIDFDNLYKGLDEIHKQINEDKNRRRHFDYKDDKNEVYFKRESSNSSRKKLLNQLRILKNRSKISL